MPAARRLAPRRPAGRAPRAALLVALATLTATILPAQPGRAQSAPAAQERAPVSAGAATPEAQGRTPGPPGAATPAVSPTVLVTRFEIVGATRWPAATLRGLLADLEGQRLTAEALERARRRVVRWYVEHGHLNSGALLPDQRIVDGVVRIEVVEGRLDAIEVSGNRMLAERYLVERLRAAADVPLDVNRIHDRLQRLQELPTIERLQARFEPGDARAAGRLHVHVTEASPWQAGLAVANNRAPSVGAIRTQVSGQHRSVSGRGDALGLRYGLARGLDDWGVEYALPLRPDDLTLTVRADAGDAQIVEAPFSTLDITSRTRSAAIGVAWPRRADGASGHTIGASIERKRSDTALLGQAFSFSPGVQDGRSVVTVLRLSADAYWRSAAQAVAARATLNRGLGIAGATVSQAGAPDGRFLSGQAQLQWARRLDERGAQAFVRADLQWSRDTLLPLEKLAVGGATSVRGYRENLLVRDQGLVVSAEYRYPLARLALAESGPLREAALQLAPFVDYGTTANRGAPTPAPRWLASVGLALRASVGRHVHAEIQYGRALNRPDGTGSNAQDRGLHFRFVLHTG